MTADAGQLLTTPAVLDRIGQDAPHGALGHHRLQQWHIQASDGLVGGGDGLRRGHDGEPTTRGAYPYCA